jgi:hypothetical protein
MNQIIVIGEDRYWLEAVQAVTINEATITIIQCQDPLLECLDCLPKPDLAALILVDAYSRLSIVEIVSKLFQLGWRYIVVVAADPSVKEAQQILRQSQNFDYWPKTYVTNVIQNKIGQMLQKIRARV